MADTIDILQIKIEKAKRELPNETLNAINAVPWQAAILKMRETKGYSFEQLDDLETETELLLCGLLSSEDYPKELKERMKISDAQANDLVNFMNEEVFSKIKAELVKITERKEAFAKEQAQKEPLPPLPLSKGEERRGSVVYKKEEESRPPKDNTAKPDLTLPELEAGKETPRVASAPVDMKKQEIPTEPESKVEVPPMLAKKLFTAIKIPSVKTDHSLGNITKTNNIPTSDPYREPPE